MSDDSLSLTIVQSPQNAQNSISILFLLQQFSRDAEETLSIQRHFEFAEFESAFECIKIGAD